MIVKKGKVTIFGRAAFSKGIAGPDILIKFKGMTDEWVELVPTSKLLSD